MQPIKSVLVIEDDRFIGEMYVRSLRSAGYEVNWQTNGNDGLIAALSKVFDLILLDIMLPGIKGSDILLELRGTDDKIPHSRVIILTNFDHNDESRAILEKRADGYLIKADVTPRKLLTIINQMGVPPSTK